MRDNFFKIIILAPSPLLLKRQGDCPNSVGVSEGATLLILAQLHLRLAPPFVKFLGPPFLIFYYSSLDLFKNKNKYKIIWF